MAAAASSVTDPGLWRVLVSRRSVMIGVIIFAIIAGAALLAPWVSPYDPFKLSIANRLKPPSARFWFGTDEFGYDIFSRTIYAGRLSLLVGLGVVVLASLIGVILGVFAGFYRKADVVLARVIDAMMAFPDVLLAIALMAALGPSLVNVIIALSVVYAPRIARVVRASTMVIRELPYVEAARAIGVSTPRILLFHILRNLVSPILVQATFVFAHAMLAEAGLSFLGVGVSPDIPTWGTMISAGRQFVGKAGWMIFFPGLAIVLAVLSLQMIGDGLRDAFDPRLTKDM